MIREYYDYVNEFVDELSQTIADYCATDSNDELNYYIERNGDEIIASAVLYYGSYKFDNFQKIYERFEADIIDRAPGLFN